MTRTMNGVCLGALAVAAHSIAAQAQLTPGTSSRPASTSPEATSSIVPADPSPVRNAADGQVGEIIVTARKVQENAQNIPVAVTAYSAMSLVRQNVAEVKDLAGKAPNLTITQGASDPGSETVSIRGQSQPDLVLTTDGAVGLYVDNVVLPRSYGLRQNMVDVQRVEVLRGPQGTLFGKNTTGGLVNVITNEPGPKLGASIDGSYGTHNSWNLLGILNTPITDDVGFRFVAQHGEHDPYGENSLGEGIMRENNSFLRAKFKAKLGRLTIRAFGDYGRSENGAAFKLAGLTPATATQPQGGLLTREAAIELYGVANPTTLAQAVTVLKGYIGTGGFYDTYGTLSDQSVEHTSDAGLDLSYELSDSVRLRSVSGYRYVDFDIIEDLDATPLHGLTPHRGADDTFYSQELQLVGGNKHFNWVVGGYASKEDGRELSTTSTLINVLSPTRPNQVNVTNGDVYGNSGAAFAQFNWEFVNRLTLTGGFRWTSEQKELTSYNHTENNGATIACSIPVSLRQDPTKCQAHFSNTFNDPTYLASLTYRPTDVITAYAKFAHGFRSGGQNYRGTTTVESFAPFKPEKDDEYEIGLKTELFDRHVRLNLAAFQDDIKDVQRAIIIFTSTGQTATVQTNAAKARVRGVEAEFDWHVTSNFSMSGAFGYIDPKYLEFSDFTGDRSHEAWPTPDITYNISATYTQPLPVGKLSATLTFTGQSKQDLYPASKQVAQVTQPGYGLLNGRIGLDIDSLDATIAVFGRNLTAKHYLSTAVGLESIGWNAVAPGEPRVVGIQLTKRFGGV